MTRREFLRCSILGASGLYTGSKIRSVKANRKAAGRPNIVLIVSDDQGYGDSSCYDHPKEVRTPNIDSLAAEGIRMTNGYASAYVCAPTRAGLLTGRYQQRFGFYAASDSRIGLPLSEVTLADMLRKQGYATAVIGKWHVGIEPEYHPLKRGFDKFYGFLGHGAHDYFDLKITSEYNSIYRNEKPINDTGYLTDNLARESVSYIERHKKQPFFLYLPFNAVHWPLQALQKYIKLFNTGDENRDIYLAMLKSMDEAIGKVLEALKRTGSDDNTLIIFSMIIPLLSFSLTMGAPRRILPITALCGTSSRAFMKAGYVCRLLFAGPVSCRKERFVTNLSFRWIPCRLFARLLVPSFPTTVYMTGRICCRLLEAGRKGLCTKLFSGMMETAF